MSLSSQEVGLKSFPQDQRPPVLIPFFAFRIMVGCGLLMLVLAWYGTWLGLKGRLRQVRWMSWCVFLSFPLGFIATLTGWFTAEVGRQPWAVYGILRTADALTPSLTLHQVAISFLIFAVIYSVIAIAGIVYVYQILQAGPDDDLVQLDKQHPVLSGASQGAAQSPAETSR